MERGYSIWQANRELDTTRPRYPMTTLREWILRLWGTLRPGRRDADLEEELRLHLEMAAEHERRRSSSPQDAARTVRLRVGSVGQGLDAVRDQRGLPWPGGLRRD